MDVGQGHVAWIGNLVDPGDVFVGQDRGAIGAAVEIGLHCQGRSVPVERDLIDRDDRGSHPAHADVTRRIGVRDMGGRAVLALGDVIAGHRTDVVVLATRKAGCIDRSSLSRVNPSLGHIQDVVVVGIADIVPTGESGCHGDTVVVNHLDV